MAANDFWDNIETSNLLQKSIYFCTLKVRNFQTMVFNWNLGEKYCWKSAGTRCPPGVIGLSCKWNRFAWENWQTQSHQLKLKADDLVFIEIAKDDELAQKWQKILKIIKNDKRSNDKRRPHAVQYSHFSRHNFFSPFLFKWRRNLKIRPCEAYCIFSMYSPWIEFFWNP